MAFPPRAQTPVDLLALHEPQAAIMRLRGPLGARQVDERQLAYLKTIQNTWKTIQNDEKSMKKHEKPLRSSQTQAKLKPKL